MAQSTSATQADALAGSEREEKYVGLRRSEWQLTLVAHGTRPA